MLKAEDVTVHYLLDEGMENALVLTRNPSNHLNPFTIEFDLRVGEPIYHFGHPWWLIPWESDVPAFLLCRDRKPKYDGTDIFLWPGKKGRWGPDTPSFRGRPPFREQHLDFQDERVKLLRCLGQGGNVLEIWETRHRRPARVLRTTPTAMWRFRRVWKGNGTVDSQVLDLTTYQDQVKDWALLIEGAAVRRDYVLNSFHLQQNMTPDGDWKGITRIRVAPDMDLNAIKVGVQEVIDAL